MPLATIRESASIGYRPSREPPIDVVDWDRWLGPSPWRPYNSKYVRGEWRAQFDFDSGATLLDWGAHTVDLCQWANQADNTMPVEYEPSKSCCTARYANGVKLVMDFLPSPFGDRAPEYRTSLGTCPVRFEGDEGWVETGDGGSIAVGPAVAPQRVDRHAQGRRNLGRPERPKLPRLRQVWRAADCQLRRDAPFAHRLPCGGHLLDVGTKAPLRPGERSIHRRRRGQQHAEPRHARTVAHLRTCPGVGGPVVGVAVVLPPPGRQYNCRPNNRPQSDSTTATPTTAITPYPRSHTMQGNT